MFVELTNGTSKTTVNLNGLVMVYCHSTTLHVVYPGQTLRVPFDEHGDCDTYLKKLQKCINVFPIG